MRDVRYCFHPWHGRAVWVHASLIRRGRAVAYCSLEDENCRVLEVPLWMLDVAACSKTAVSKLAFVSADSLRELKEILESARLQGNSRQRRKHSMNTCKMQKVLRVVPPIPRRQNQLPYSLVPSAIRAGQTCRPVFNRRRCHCWRSYSDSIEQQRQKAKSHRSCAMSEKIKPHHIGRKAILYVRQSSTFQVQNNLAGC